MFEEIADKRLNIYACTCVRHFQPLSSPTGRRRLFSVKNCPKAAGKQEDEFVHGAGKCCESDPTAIFNRAEVTILTREPLY